VRDERLVRHQRREARLVLAICEGISASSREDLELKVGWAPLREEVEDAERERLRATFNGTGDVQHHEKIPPKVMILPKFRMISPTEVVTCVDSLCGL
jgi:hypothetical protein